MYDELLQEKLYGNSPHMNIFRAGFESVARIAQSRCLARTLYDRLFAELRMEDQQSFFNFLRTPPDMFDELLNRVGTRIPKLDTNYWKASEPGLKLAATIRHLASGDRYSSPSYAFRVAGNTCALFIPEVCRAVVSVLKNEVISCPVTPDEWRLIVDQFSKRRNVPHACAAIDRTHVALLKPSNSGSL